MKKIFKNISELALFLDGISGRKIAPEDVFPERAGEVLDAVIRLDNELREAEKFWRQNMSGKIDKPEIPEEEKRKARLRYLRSRIREDEDTMEYLKGEYVFYRRLNIVFCNHESEELARRAELVSNRLQKNKRAYEAYKRNDEVTPDMIDRARQYPIKNIIEVNRNGFALCLWHEEDTPSMFTRGNWIHCFGCEKHADAIDVYRKRTGASFIEAVKMLQA